MNAGLASLAALRPRLAEIRRDAVLACALSPATWLAVHGVPVATYLAELDRLDALAAEAEAKLGGAGA